MPCQVCQASPANVSPASTISCPEFLAGSHAQASCSPVSRRSRGPYILRSRHQRKICSSIAPTDCPVGHSSPAIHNVSSSRSGRSGGDTAKSRHNGGAQSVRRNHTGSRRHIRRTQKDETYAPIPVAAGPACRSQNPCHLDKGLLVVDRPEGTH